MSGSVLSKKKWKNTTCGNRKKKPYLLRLSNLRGAFQQTLREKNTWKKHLVHCGSQKIQNCHHRRFWQWQAAALPIWILLWIVGTLDTWSNRFARTFYQPWWVTMVAMVTCFNCLGCNDANTWMIEHFKVEERNIEQNRHDLPINTSKLW